MLDQVAQRYGKRPSELLGIDNAVLGLTVDIRCAVLGSSSEKAQIDKAAKRRR